MNNPPQSIDGAEVLLWSWSGDRPFFSMEPGNSEFDIYGLAICKYANSDTVYKFSCDRNWETKNDLDFASVEEAIEALSTQYDSRAIRWIKFAS